MSKMEKKGGGESDLRIESLGQSPGKTCILTKIVFFHIGNGDNCFLWLLSELDDNLFMKINCKL